MNFWFRPTKLSPACFFRDPGSGLTLSECGAWRSKVVAKSEDGRESIPAGKYPPDFEICPKCARALGTTPKPQHVKQVKLGIFSREDLIPIEDMKLPRKTRADESDFEVSADWEAQVDF